MRKIARRRRRRNLRVRRGKWLPLRGKIIPVYNTPVLQSKRMITGTVDRSVVEHAPRRSSRNPDSLFLPSLLLLVLLVSTARFYSCLDCRCYPRPSTTCTHSLHSYSRRRREEQVLVEEGGTRSESKIEADDRIPKDRRHLTRMATVD